MSISQGKIGEQAVEPGVWLECYQGDNTEAGEGRQKGDWTQARQLLVLISVSFAWGHILSRQVHLWPVTSGYSPP